MSSISGNKDRKLRTEEVVISASGTVSTAKEIGTSKLVAIVMPSAWTTADIKFQVAAPGTTTFQTVIDATGADVTVQSPAASKTVALSSVAIEGLGIMKLVSTQTQAAARTITLILKDE